MISQPLDYKELLKKYMKFSDDSSYRQHCGMTPSEAYARELFSKEEWDFLAELALEVRKECPDE